tara:strand:- start:619 stop:1365 length:747 start_codon:yes stop_codon:yes gene_type:complete
MKLIETYKSFNFDKRNTKEKLKYIILHYTAMSSYEEALDYMCERKNKVSTHFLVTKKGDIFYIVDIKNRAWHAGNSYWNGTKDLNSSSIGIEIDNSGPHILNENFTNIQVNSLCKLIKKLSTKYNIESKNILGHSDIAPYRKIDPGEKFPWISLYKKKLCYLPNISKKKIVLEKSSKSLQYYKKKEYLEILRKLGFIGYDIRGVQLKDKKFKLLLQAYQRHYRQSDISGNADNQTIRLINTHYKDMLT